MTANDFLTTPKRLSGEYQKDFGFKIHPRRSFHHSSLFLFNSKPNIYRLVSRSREEKFSTLIDFKLYLIVQLHENYPKASVRRCKQITLSGLLPLTEKE